MTWLSLLLFYQVFVNSRYERISLKQAVSAFNQLKYKAPVLGQPAPPPDSGKIEVACQEFCQFNLIDLKTGSLIKTLPAREDFNPAGRLKELKLAFIDSQSGLIGYEGKASADRAFYVINFQAELIQVVKLSLNNQLNFEFIDYYPQTQQILFRSDQGENFLYAANRPSLQLLWNYQ